VAADNPAEPELKKLRREMAARHPDCGGTNEEFMAARERYERALRRASRFSQQGRVRQT